MQPNFSYFIKKNFDTKRQFAYFIYIDHRLIEKGIIMNEIDLYSAYRLPSATKKKEKMPKKGGHKFFIIFILLMCLVIIFLIANAFSNILTFSSVSLFNGKTVAKSYNAYAIVIGNFEDEQSAKQFSEEVQTAGAGGYVIYDLDYSVILNVYLTADDAQNVLEKVLLTYSNAELKVLGINRCELSNVSDKVDTKTVESALNIFKSTYKSLYDICLKLDTSQSTSQETKVALTSLLNETSEVVSAFRDISDEAKNTQYSLTLAKVDQVVSLLNNLVESALSSTRLSSLIKNTQISCLMLQNELSLLLD